MMLILALLSILVIMRYAQLAKHVEFIVECFISFLVISRKPGQSLSIQLSVSYLLIHCIVNISYWQHIF